MLNWIAVQCDYEYLNRDPDPLVQPMKVHWGCQDVEGADVGELYGADLLADTLPQFAESQIIRVTSAIMLGWLHDAMGTEWVTEREDAATAALELKKLPPMGSTPPDDT